MRLRRLDLTRYGRFSDARLDFGARPDGGPDLHVVYGLNEAGKSTAFAAFRDLLFGIDRKAPYGWLHGAGQLEIGAALDFEGATHELRRIGRKGASLLDEVGRPLPEATLAGPLAGLTRESYAAMFSLDETSLAEGGEAILDAEGDLGALLFSASAGLAELGRALAAMREEADELHRRQASKTRIAALRRELADIEAQRKAIDVQASAHAQLAAEAKTARQAYEAAAAELADERQAQARRQGLLRGLPVARDHAGAAARLAELGELPHPPAGWSKLAAQLIEDDARLDARRAGLEERAERLVDEIDAITIDEPALALASRIDALAGLTDRWSGAQKDLPNRRRELALQEEKLRHRLRLLERVDADPRALDLPAQVVARLRDLIEQLSGIETNVQRAAEELDDAEATLARVTADAERLEQPGDEQSAGAVAALRSVAARAKAGDLDGLSRRARRDVEAARRARDDAFARLAPWRGDAPALRAATVADARRIEAWRKDLAQKEAQRAAAQARLAELVTEARESAARLDAAREAAGRIDDGRAEAAMAAREAAWTRHLATLDRPGADAFEKQMRAVDALATARLDGADALARLREAATQSRLREARIARQRELADEAEAALAAFAAALAAATPAALRNTDDAAPDAMIARLEEWARAREAALAAEDAFAAAEAARETLDSQAGEERAGLAAALAAFGVESAGLDLSATITAAETALAAEADRQKARSLAAASLREAGRKRDERRKRAEAAQASLDQWRARWSAALAGLWFADRAEEPKAVRALLDAAAELPAELTAREATAHRVLAMEEDQTRFVAELDAICAALGEMRGTRAPPEVAAALSGRLAAARAARQKRAGRRDDLDALTEERAALAAAAREHEARKAQMLAFFGADDLASVAQALRACEERDRLVEVQAQRARRLVEETGAASAEAALGTLGEVDAAALRREAGEAESRIDLLDGRVRELFAAATRAQDRLDAIGGDDAAARLEARRRTTLIDMQETATRCLRLRVGEMLATDALRVYRDRHRSAMMRRASEAFRLVTRGDYSGLSTQSEPDRETLIARARDGAARNAAQLSTGARAQLYLALRVAGYEEFAALRPPAPFVADDIMETFDEPRAEQAFRLLARMAGHGQVIYLTHHRHLCDIARAVAPETRILDLGT